MALHAESVQVSRVENGWVVIAFAAGSSVTLVAKTIDEAVGFLKGMEWTTPRPLNYGDGPPVMAGGSTLGSGRY